MESLANYLRLIASKAEGEVVKPFMPSPGIKPKRRRPSFQNVTYDVHYQRDQKREKVDEGMGYQKKPEKVKKWLQEQRKRLKEKGL
jgi:hypothetical protein